MNTRYSVVHYVNGRMTQATPHLSKRSAYEAAIPQEARIANEGNRWHVMLYLAAVERMGELFVGETLRVCWQEYSPDFDTKHILIMREEDGFNLNVIDNNIINYIN